MPPAIRATTVRAVDLPLERHVQTAAGAMATAPLVLIDVRTEDGLTGRSYLRAYTPLALRGLAALVEDLAEAVRGRPADPAAVRAELCGALRILGTPGLAGAAVAGLDMALWDLAAQRAGEPLARLLGATADRVPAYASLRSMGVEAALAEAEAALAAGFRGIKAKVGARDGEVLGALRALAGEDVELMADYNQSLGVEEAIERARALEPLRLAWIEEPTRAGDFTGHARIAAAVDTPIQLGENWHGVAEMEQSVGVRASDHAMLDAMRIGGVSGWLEAAALAARHGLPVSSHTFPEFSVHLLAASPTGHRLEYLDHVAPLLERPVRVSGGYAEVPDVPGVGIAWDEAAIARLQPNR
jgi:mandelate racemase